MTDLEPAAPLGAAAKPPRTWLPMALWSAGIALALGLAWLGSEVYALHRLEKVLVVSELTPRSRLVWIPDLKGAVSKLGGPERTLGLLRRYLALNRPYRKEAILLLGACGRPAVPDLVRHLHSEDLLCRGTALTALCTMGHSASDALPEVVEIARNSANPAERRAAVVSLRPIGGNSPEVIAALIAALRDPDWEAADWAAAELEMLGAAAVPALRAASNDETPSVRIHAAEALKKILDKELPK